MGIHPPMPLAALRAAVHIEILTSLVAQEEGLKGDELDERVDALIHAATAVLHA